MPFPTRCMLIQKIFHVHQGLEETEKHLGDLHSLRRVLQGVELAVGNGSAHVEFVTGAGFRGDMELVQLPCDEPNQRLFRSANGNIDLCGLIELYPVRPDLTEVQLTVEYAIKSPMYSLLDTITSSVDRFVNRQLRRVQAQFVGASRSLIGSDTPGEVQMLGGRTQLAL